MPFLIDDVLSAKRELDKFRLDNLKRGNLAPHHERFIFPFLCGSYFAYRKIDVKRIVAIAHAVSKDNPSYLDVGCGYGDFLEKIRQYLPNAEGMEKSADIFFKLKKYKPDYIKIGDAYNGIEKRYDVIFVGWMEPGVDYRDKIAEKTDVIVTTLDQGGQCGKHCGCEMEEYGFKKVASWLTPSWIDVNTELMNKYYSSMTEGLRRSLHELRGAHNLWYIYSKPNYVESVRKDLLEYDSKISDTATYDHEKILDELGYRVNERLPLGSGMNLWKIEFEN
ncbi:class I SAM-dependent methyltransferase [Candidatus Nitrosocosmicus sp. SS]|jgi:SAM-dependent methyltransferase|uniref:class I SAM-dependent methyltransferase n=1 Tax=Candidatus Nitrosocosmicus agrestis TaxID=2563600 RepID=UPI00122E7A85|nr:class I SAM-dependent methyltransferase [Candidatus Nitrosocosmicus sp. SS]KAA2283824.1 class I SAM-dependent methyltransferase [Candidatus Nitrosocosmicus sp. SS]KAF0870200.1 class I SAM-dependent methyltransferase [Candidatus Nitrosocosmicus sp. SS]MDR4489377.1 class I SAM-dependent methyltransferase [Candidatus Nitrosocosmicus sp.]